MQSCIWDNKDSQLSIIPLGQEEFAFPSNVTGHILCTLIKTSAERAEEEICLALKENTFVSAVALQYRRLSSSKPCGLCALALMS